MKIHNTKKELKARVELLALLAFLAAFSPSSNMATALQHTVGNYLSPAATCIQYLHYSDVTMSPDLPASFSMANELHSPDYYETTEYLIGDVAVGIVFLESNGTMDPSTEDWTATEESNVINEITTGLNWLASQNPPANISFTYDIHYHVPTSYEPITRSSSDDRFWIDEAMTYLGYSGSWHFSQVRDYLNALRDTLDSDWAYAIFIVDSSNDPDGKFADGRFAYSYFGGPYLVMTYDNNGWGIANMDRVTVHETCHIFFATDEWNGITEYSGYLNASDVENSGGIMDNLSWNLSSGTKQQVGWRDVDDDGIQDIIDTFPDTSLTPYFPDPTTNTTLTYTGSVTVSPYPNNNPRGTGRNVTINIITNVEFRVDEGSWVNATPVSGAFDETVENFTFTTPSLPAGTHTIATRGINSVGNIENSCAIDIITVEIATQHNIVVNNVTLSKVLVNQGFTLDLNVTVTNEGDFTESFNVTAYADQNTTILGDEITIETLNVTLTAGTFTTITFTWDTTDVTCGSYTVSALGDTVSGETNIEDNSYTDGTILVTIQGDVNGDRTVDILDAGLLSAHWYPGPPIGPLGYNANVDINNDGNIDITDQAVVNAYWHQSW